MSDLMPSEYIGRTGFVRDAGDARKLGDTLEYAVRVIEFRRVFGRVELLVQPLTGKGERWMDVKSVRFIE